MNLNEKNLRRLLRQARYSLSEATGFSNGVQSPDGKEEAQVWADKIMILIDEYFHDNPGSQKGDQVYDDGIPDNDQLQAKPDNGTINPQPETRGLLGGIKSWLKNRWRTFRQWLRKSWRKFSTIWKGMGDR